MARAELHCGDCRDVLPTLEADSFDACVTDPPYGLSFMGKGWDHGVPGVEFWQAVHRVLKSGAVLLAFGGTRTYHRQVCAIEDAGFLIEDSIHWIYGQGFPKHKSKLKPAHEPIAIARKPGPKWLGVDACRVENVGPDTTSRPNCVGKTYEGKHGYDGKFGLNAPMLHPAGRYPPNLCFVHHPDCRSVGTRRVKGTAPIGRPSVGAALANSIGPTGLGGKPRPDGGYADPDGTEEVVAWECVEGEVERQWIASLGSTEIDLTSAEEDELFAFAGLLVRALRDDSRTVDRRENPGCESDRAVPESGSPGFQAGCQSCHRSGDALLRQIRVASQESARRLGDVLESALCRAHLSSHSQPDQPDGHPSSCDASPLSGANRGTNPSKNAGERLPAFLPDKVDHTPRRGAWEPLSNGPHGGNGESSNGESGAPGIRFCSDCRTEAVRRFCLSCAYWASEYFLPDLIIRTVEARVNYCPVRLLDEQAGERKGDRPGRKPRVNTSFVFGWSGPEGHSHQTAGFIDSGSASRFFPTFAWSDADDLTPFLYCPKASRSERGHFNNHPTVKPLALTRWLLKLACPAGGTALDPFLGSGTTAVACVELGLNCVGIDDDPDSYAIARRRVGDADARYPLFGGA